VRGGPRTTAEEYGNASSANGIGGELLAEHPAGAQPTAPQKEYGRSGRSMVTVTPQSVSVVNPGAYQTPDSTQGIGDFTFTTPGTTPLVISNVAAGGISTSGATITWTTDEFSDSQVEYGTTTAYGQVTFLNPAFVTSHSVRLSGLTPERLYHYRVRSRNGLGLLKVSDDFTFTTSDATPPTVTSFTPAAGATNVNSNVIVTVTFSEYMSGASLISAMELRDPSNVLVPATVMYDAPSFTAMLNPNASLAAGVTYTARSGVAVQTHGQRMCRGTLWPLT
jgi:hypothetical protein